jgi:hypothetical protein
VGPRVGLNAVAKRKKIILMPLPGIEEKNLLSPNQIKKPHQKFQKWLNQ